MAADRVYYWTQLSRAQLGQTPAVADLSALPRLR